MPSDTQQSLLAPAIVHDLVKIIAKGLANRSIGDHGKCKVLDAKPKGLLLDVGGQKVMVGFQACQ